MKKFFLSNADNGNVKMEADTISKNGRSYTSQKCRRKFFGFLFCLIAAVAMSSVSCNKDKDNDKSGDSFFVYDGVTYLLDWFYSWDWESNFEASGLGPGDKEHGIELYYTSPKTGEGYGKYTYSEKKVQFTFQEAYIYIEYKGIEKLEIKDGSFTILENDKNDVFTFDLTAVNGKKVTGKYIW